jgi:hypothetical protein
MLAPFLRVAMTSPARQASFRRVVVGHVALVAALMAIAIQDGSLGTLAIVAQVLLVLGIVEGAALIGWRLTQLPKSQALEFLLVSPVSSRQFFAAEFAVGFGRFLLVQLAALPVLALAIFAGIADWFDLAALAGMPAVWGLVAGLGLTTWIYEPKSVRRVGEMLALFGVLVYLVIGVLAAENLRLWLQSLPPVLGEFLFDSIMYLHAMNPFGVVRYWFATDCVTSVAWHRFWNLNLASLAVCSLLTLRAGARLVGHFHDRHYKPIDSSRASQLEFIGDRPLSWWAVRRVMEYSGRVNLYLAGGFCCAYTAYIVAGDAWPAWIGRGAFILFDRWGGPAMVATAMAVMAAVPAVYQYGLWDSSVQARCARLELLLLTDLSANDYAHAAFRAAWTRGRGYLLAAALLWIACALAGRITPLDALAAALGSLLLWAFAFAVGFRGFATGHQTNGIASLLTLGCPMILYALWAAGLPLLAALVPTGVAFLPMKTGISMEWLCGFTLTSSVTIWLGYQGLTHCDSNLRRWYDANQGLKATA